MSRGPTPSVLIDFTLDVIYSSSWHIRSSPRAPLLSLGGIPLSFGEAAFRFAFGWKIPFPLEKGTHNSHHEKVAASYRESNNRTFKEDVTDVA